MVDWNFITQYPRRGMTEGGILPAILGTFLVTLLTTIFAIPLGIACAIYLNEYAADTWLTQLIRASIRNLAGVPSIIYGLFGVAIFVRALHLGTAVISSGLTLGLLSLPYIITTTEEALKNVPKGLREVSLALGSTKWELFGALFCPSLYQASLQVLYLHSQEQRVKLLLFFSQESCSISGTCLPIFSMNLWHCLIIYTFFLLSITLLSKCDRLLTEPHWC